MITGRHFQNAYVTRNRDKAVESFRAHADVRKVLDFEGPVQLWTPRGEGTGVQKLAFIWVEDLNLEVIEPQEGETLAIYREALPQDDRLVFHHICQAVDDWDAFLARVEDQPYPMVLKGGSPGLLQFAYLDTRDWLGHYIEYVWMAPERWAAMGGR